VKKYEPVLSGQERNAARRAMKSLFRNILLIKTYVSDDDLKKGDNVVIRPETAAKLSPIKLMLLEVDHH
jgi:hypothetical protein